MMIENESENRLPLLTEQSELNRGRRWFQAARFKDFRRRVLKFVVEFLRGYRHCCGVCPQQTCLTLLL